MSAIISGFTNVKKQGTALLFDYLEVIEKDEQNFVFNDWIKISALYDSKCEEEFQNKKINAKFTFDFE